MPKSKIPWFECALYDADDWTLERQIVVAQQHIRRDRTTVVVLIPPGEAGAGWHAASSLDRLEPHEHDWIVWRSDASAP